MKPTAADIEEARRLATQSERQIRTQMEMNQRMRQSGTSTGVAEEALRSLLRTRDEIRARLQMMLNAPNGDKDEVATKPADRPAAGRISRLMVATSPVVMAWHAKRFVAFEKLQTLGREVGR